ncbi:DUF397 domain-containing protein [Streptomyces mobaraensis NBRC 13819 = DSM 40847]|uniref:DUF397 domain-containing protein n=1 Tax=Streptomyces mobaraensis TaxID=35621 RepID=A0A5N5W996_STRMB|nr:DUF397 domain-containing protein [Streptomyces mobaraensis]QTT78104.1 DUF397 domain-containing protein [Streptomyces mobaraensis NBRC 13819 = DSM 40847]
MPESAWRKSSYSNNDGSECVEVAHRADSAVPVRDSKRPHGPHLTLPAPAWTTFIDAVKGRTLRG